MPGWARGMPGPGGDTVPGGLRAQLPRRAGRAVGRPMGAAGAVAGAQPRGRADRRRLGGGGTGAGTGMGPRGGRDRPRLGNTPPAPPPAPPGRGTGTAETPGMQHP